MISWQFSVGSWQSVRGACAFLQDFSCQSMPMAQRLKVRFPTIREIHDQAEIANCQLPIVNSFRRSVPVVNPNLTKINLLILALAIEGRVEVVDEHVVALLLARLVEGQDKRGQ